jgi:hypothetical protein
MWEIRFFRDPGKWFLTDLTVGRILGKDTSTARLFQLMQHKMSLLGVTPVQKMPQIFPWVVQFQVELSTYVEWTRAVALNPRQYKQGTDQLSAGTVNTQTTQTTDSVEVKLTDSEATKMFVSTEFHIRGRGSSWVVENFLIDEVKNRSKGRETVTVSSRRAGLELVLGYIEAHVGDSPVRYNRLGGVRYNWLGGEEVINPEFHLRIDIDHVPGAGLAYNMVGYRPVVMLDLFALAQEVCKC